MRLWENLFVMLAETDFQDLPTILLLVTDIPMEACRDEVIFLNPLSCRTMCCRVNNSFL